MAAAWEPTAKYLERSRLRAFAERQGHHDYASLLRWSIEDPDAFWRATERDLGLVWRVPYTQVLDTSRGIPWATWWTGGRMNYVATALRHEAGRIAVIAEGEEGTVRQLTFGELSAEVARCAAGLRSLGVRKGDRVAVFLPLTVECAVAVLAIGAIGAVLVPVFSGYGAEAIAGRLRAAEGCAARPRRFPGEGRAGPRALLRPPGRGPNALVDGHRLDDGPVARCRRAHARRDDRALRRHARLPRSLADVVHRRTPSGDPPRDLAHRDPRADARRRGARAREGPLVAFRARLDRGALEPRSLVVVLPERRRGAVPDHQLLGRHRGLGRHRRLHDLDADRGVLVQRALSGHGR